MKKGKDISIAIKKVSLSSLDNLGIKVIKNIDGKIKDAAPRDKFYYVHILFLLLGLMHFVPYSFFLTANAYWMYKFRNVTADITDTDARTLLQTHFSPGNNIINAIFSPVTTVVSAFLGYKIKARLRVLVILTVMSLSFIAGTAFVEINTDSWQVPFFVITLIILGMISAANAAFAAANMSILSRFPKYFMKLYLLGEGLGGISNAILQILSLALGTSTEVSALFYFVAGSALMTLTLMLFYFSKYNRLYNHYITTVKEDASKDVLTLSEAKALIKKIWSPIVTFLILFATMIPVLPNITSLVVSENYGSGSEWSDKYFVPVVSFLLNEIVGMTGRATASKVDKKFSGLPLTIFMILRMCILLPLIYFCNAQPRHHLPLLLPHDWQYIIILCVFTFTNGYILNMIVLNIAQLVSPEEIEDAYLVFLSCTSICTVLCTPLGLFSVDVL